MRMSSAFPVLLKLSDILVRSVQSCRVSLLDHDDPFPGCVTYCLELRQAAGQTLGTIRVRR